MIKVTIGGEPKKEKEIPFPKLMISNGVSSTKGDKIIFMTRKNCGFLISCVSKSHDIGYYGEVWDMDCLSDYNEPITLQNITK